MSEADRLFAFIRGVKPAIATQLRVHGVKTVDQAIEMAMRIGSMGDFASLTSGTNSGAADDPMQLDALDADLDEQDQQQEHAPVTRAEFQQLLAAMRNQRKPHGRDHPRGNKPHQQSGTPGFKVNGLTPDQVRAHLDAGTCFLCGKPDHRSRACPDRNKFNQKQSK